MEGRKKNGWLAAKKYPTEFLMFLLDDCLAKKKSATWQNQIVHLISVS